MNTKLDREELNRLAEKFARAFAHYHDQPDGTLHEMLLVDLEYLVGCARMLLGVGCCACGGVGRKGYGSTATWQGGVGGQAITEGVCDVCWGTGRIDRTGVDLRRLASLQREVEMLKKTSATEPTKQAPASKTKKTSIKESKRREAIGRQVQYLDIKNKHMLLGIVTDAYYDVGGALRLKVQHWPFDPLASEVYDIE